MMPYIGKSPAYKHESMDGALAAMRSMVESTDEAVNGDQEYWHEKADAILCAVLRELGHKELVDLYESLDMWYA